MILIFLLPNGLAQAASEHCLIWINSVEPVPESAAESLQNGRM
jgi:hypothetical protein